jgi:hypothetical protein
MKTVFCLLAGLQFALACVCLYLIWAALRTGDIASGFLMVVCLAVNVGLFLYNLTKIAAS